MAEPGFGFCRQRNRLDAVVAHEAHQSANAARIVDGLPSVESLVESDKDITPEQRLDEFHEDTPDEAAAYFGWKQCLEALLAELAGREGFSARLSLGDIEERANGL